MTNYGTTTTSATEWWYVTDPDGGLPVLGLTSWPLEENLVKVRETRMQCRIAKVRAARMTCLQPEGLIQRAGRGGGVPLSELSVPTARALLQAPIAFETERRAINEKLDALGERPFLVEEFIAARLYTGPMYLKVPPCPPLAPFHVSLSPCTRRSTTACCAGWAGRLTRSSRHSTSSAWATSTRAISRRRLDGSPRE